MQCWNCKYNRNIDHQFCQKCLSNLYNPNNIEDIRRKPMTDWEKKKLSFYRSEKKWIEDIRNRQAFGESKKKGYH